MSKITLSLTVTVDGQQVNALEWVKAAKTASPYIDHGVRTFGSNIESSGRVDVKGTWSDTFNARDDLTKLATAMRGSWDANKSKFKKHGAKTVTITAIGDTCQVVIEALTKTPSATKVILHSADGAVAAPSKAKTGSAGPAKIKTTSSSSVGMWQEGMIIIRAIDGVSENVTQDFLRLNSGGSDLMKYLRSGEGRGQWKFARNGDAQLEVLRKVKHVMDPEEYKKYLWRNYIGVSLSNKLKEGKLAVENWSIKIVEAEPDYYHYIFRFEIPGYKSKQGFQGLRV